MSQADNSDQSVDLTFNERIRLMELTQKLRGAPSGVVGLIETRNLFARLFPDFAQVKDEELDAALEGYAKEQAENNPSATDPIEGSGYEPDLLD